MKKVSKDNREQNTLPSKYFSLAHGRERSMNGSYWSQVLTQRISRRRALAGTAAGAGAGEGGAAGALHGIASVFGMKTSDLLRRAKL